MIRLIIADANHSYIKALATYLQIEHGQVIEVTCFTQSDVLQEYLLGNGPVDILLVDEKLLSNQLKTDNIKTVILLVESILDSNMTTIYKFQKADQITKLLLEAFDKSSGSISNIPKNNNESRIICVYSPAGATGKSTIAYNLAHQYAMQNQKILFLSFETFSSFSFLKRSEPAKGLIFLMYLLKNKHPNLQLKLNSIKAVDTDTNIHYIERESNVLEYKDIKMEDMELLADFLKKQSGYDVIIIDMDSTINEITLGILKHCDAIANVLCNNDSSCKKQEEFIKQIPKINDLLKVDIFSKLINVVNSCKAVDEVKYIESQCCGKVEIPYINCCNIGRGAYFPEMVYFKQLHDMLENFFSVRMIIDDGSKQ
jgi:cellulose biosynthesis protein BcsQ